MREIFPGGRLPSVAIVEEHAVKCGFEVDLVQSLRRHYPRTLDIWAASLSANKAEAIAIQSEEVYERYMKYLTGCADLFRDGYTDVASSRSQGLNLAVTGLYKPRRHNHGPKKCRGNHPGAAHSPQSGIQTQVYATVFGRPCARA